MAIRFFMEQVYGTVLFIKQIALAAIGEANETYKDFFDMGVVQTVVYDCEETVFGVFLPMMINAALGYEDMTKMDGHPLVIPDSPVERIN